MSGARITPGTKPEQDQQALKNSKEKGEAPASPGLKTFGLHTLPRVTAAHLEVDEKGPDHDPYKDPTHSFV